MIVVRFKSGKDWEWKETDRLSVNGESFTIADIGKIEMEGMIVGGRDITVGGAVWRDLLLRDPETMVPFIASMPVDKAREVGIELARAGEILIATQMPRPPA